MKPPFPVDSSFNCMQSLMSVKPGVGERRAGRLCQHRSAPTETSAIRGPAPSGTGITPARDGVYLSHFLEVTSSLPGRAPRRAGKGKATLFAAAAAPRSDPARSFREAGTGRLAPSRRKGRPPPPLAGDGYPLPARGSGARLTCRRSPQGMSRGAATCAPLIPPELLKQARVAPLRASPAPHGGAHTDQRPRPGSDRIRGRR